MKPTDAWLATVCRTSLTTHGDVEQMAIENMRSFGLTLDTAQDVIVEDVVTFLEKTACIYAKRLAAASVPMLFYAWHDAMAGALRCSAAPGETPRDLPFGCELEVCRDAVPIAASLLSSPYLDGIPMDELEACEWAAVDEVDAPRPVLAVFVRALPRSVR